MTTSELAALLDRARRWAAEACRMDSEVGSLVPGKRADLIAIGVAGTAVALVVMRRRDVGR